ncbi:ogr/Delta-like zinc finger family protein [Kiloniella laminariae]|uniref:ogr/Delta-like zinc finger family protein n=1 Tax=Kiloniella laminariae TaxID=454162 RepID=UPI003AFA3EE0
MQLQRDFFCSGGKTPEEPSQPDRQFKSYYFGHYPKMMCPHCKGACLGIKTEQQTDLVREITYFCSTRECGHIFVAQLTPIRTIHRSKIPDPEIRLPNYSD